MYWYERPPWLRWTAASLLLLGAVAWELRPTPYEPRPFAARPVAAGQYLSHEDVEWREVPAGLLPMADLSMPLAVDIGEGSPIIPDLLGEAAAIPDDWWSVAVPLPSGARLGAKVRLVTESSTTDGLVIDEPEDDPFAGSAVGLVAVPPEAAADIARAAASGELILLLAP